MEKGVVTLLDVLGWKGIWKRKEDSIDVLLGIIQDSEKKANEVRSSISSYKHLKFDIISISDTVAITTIGKCEDALEFHGGLCSVLIIDSIIKGIPLRGATCYGEFSKKENVLVGPAIDEVASWYEQAQWIGVILTPSALFESSHEYHYNNNFLIKYRDVMVKNYGKYETYCVNWPRMWINTKKETVASLKKRLLDMAPITPDIALKLINTVSFCEYVNERVCKIKCASALSLSLQLGGKAGVNHGEEKAGF